MILAIEAVFPMEKLRRLARSLRLLFHVKFLFFARRRLQGLTDNVLASYVDCFSLKQNVCLFRNAFFAISSPFELFCALGELENTKIGTTSSSNHIPPRLSSHRLFRFSKYLAYVFFFRSLSEMVVMFVSSFVFHYLSILCLHDSEMVIPALSAWTSLNTNSLYRFCSCLFWRLPSHNCPKTCPEYHAVILTI